MVVGSLLFLVFTGKNACNIYDMEECLQSSEGLRLMIWFILIWFTALVRTAAAELQDSSSAMLASRSKPQGWHCQSYILSVCQSIVFFNFEVFQ